ncbi:response regulator [Ramlibacter terrae]|uniref:Response regulator n=1 Tax=Ramlibacter terrae TaxID=2732511 RepID=A0ABX6P1S2_9BURK|nr:response regulator [Ramlibacter terrae]
MQTATDGNRALEVGAKLRPDVAILDIGMPHLNGYEAAAKIRETDWGRQVVLIALTGWGRGAGPGAGARGGVRPPLHEAGGHRPPAPARPGRLTNGNVFPASGARAGPYQLHLQTKGDPDEQVPHPLGPRGLRPRHFRASRRHPGP